MTNKVDRLEKLMAEMLEIYKAKNKDYGDSFSESFEEFGLIAPVVRMNDKINRIKSLSKKGGRQVKDESLRDSLMDLANYALMTVVELDLQIEEWERKNIGTVEIPDAFQKAIMDHVRESKLENNSDRVLQRIESLDDDKKYYLKPLLSEIEEENCHLTKFLKKDIIWLVKHFDIDLDDFEIIEVKSDYEAGRQENL